MKIDLIVHRFLMGFGGWMIASLFVIGCLVGCSKASPQPKNPPVNSSDSNVRPGTQPTVSDVQSAGVDPTSVPPVQPAPATKPVIDHVLISVGDSVTFNIPITDPTWPKDKDSLPRFQFDGQAWSRLASQYSRIDLEKRLHDEFAASYLRALQQSKIDNQPVINELASAEYLAQQPGATEAQKQASAALAAKDDPILDKSTKYLRAVKILLDAIKDDIGETPGYSENAAGQISAKTTGQ